jgi:hypothetical protein
MKLPAANGKSKEVNFSTCEEMKKPTIPPAKAVIPYLRT